MSNVINKPQKIEFKPFKLFVEGRDESPRVAIDITAEFLRDILRKALALNDADVSQGVIYGYDHVWLEKGGHILNSCLVINPELGGAKDAQFFFRGKDVFDYENDACESLAVSVSGILTAIGPNSADESLYSSNFLLKDGNLFYTTQEDVEYFAQSVARAIRTRNASPDMECS